MFDFFNVYCLIKFCFMVDENIGLSEHICILVQFDFIRKCFTIKTDDKSENGRRQ